MCVLSLALNGTALPESTAAFGTWNLRENSELRLAIVQ